MASKLLRRSGVSVGLISELIGWRADVIYQVGVGQYHQEVDVLKSEWPGVKFIGFEPHPAIYREIKQEYPGELFNKAVGSYVGFLKLFWNPRHKDGASLLPTGQVGECATLIPVTTLDSMGSPVTDQRVLLWLDCEGFEMEVLKGAEQFIHAVDVVNVEMTSCPIAKGWSRPVDIHRWLIARGFYRQWVHTQRSSQGQYDAIYVQSKLFRSEYSCDPWEQERFAQCQNVE